MKSDDSIAINRYASDAPPNNGPIADPDKESFVSATPSTAHEVPTRNGLLGWWWRRRSVRAQLLIVIILIDMMAALAAGSVVIVQTRTSVQVEIAASMRLAELLVLETIQMQQGAPADQFFANLPLQIRFLRHVRISAQDPTGRTLATRPMPVGTGSPDGDDRPAAPAWFAALVASQIEQKQFPIAVGGQTIGSVVVTGAPRDEIAEAWENAAALATVALPVNVGVIALFYLLFGRVLRPIARLADGLSDLERRNYDVRLLLPDAAEMAAITHRFNALAEALRALRVENRGLHRRLVTIQDDERRDIALELHDEFGPNLFGLKAMAGSIALAVGDEQDAAGRKVAERSREMLSVIEHMQVMNRSLLNRLRPMALGHVPLENLLSELVRDRARQHPQITFSFSGKGLIGDYGDSFELTIYRCVQESLTNAIRHAEARSIAVDVANNVQMDKSSPSPISQIVLSVRDDGRGIDTTKPKGFGLQGMQERVQALGGDYTIESKTGIGTCVRIAIPVQQIDSNNG